MQKLAIYIIFGFAVLMLISCEKMFVEQPANNPEAIFENLWSTFNEEYAPFEERNVDWDAQYNLYRPLVHANTTDSDLFEIISQMLASLDDGHVGLTAPNRKTFYSNNIRNLKIDDELFDMSVIKSNYLEAGYKEGEEQSYVYGKLKDYNMAYINFKFVGPNFFALNDFLEEYKNADGFVIDLRHNDGGDFTYCFSEIQQLTNEKRYVFRSKTKNGKGKNDYTDWHEWFIEPSASGKYVNKPMVVLTDRYTISAGERSVMAFKTLPNVIIVGDTTNGGHGTMIGRELANGWFYSLVPQKVEMPDGQSYEGVGIAPDVYVKNQMSEIEAGQDKTLQTAIDKLQ